MTANGKTRETGKTGVAEGAGPSAFSININEINGFLDLFSGA